MNKAVFVELADKRYEYVLELLIKEGFAAFSRGEESLYADYQKIYIMSLLFEVSENFARQLDNNSYLFSGKISDDVAKIIAEKNITHINILEDELFLYKNAYVTAECALSYIIDNTPLTLSGMNTLILGYGRVGKCMAEVLKNNKAKINVVTDNAKESAEAAVFADGVFSIGDFAAKLGDYDAIINTIPKLILKGEIKQLNKDCFLLDLASLPGGIDKKEADRLGIKYIHALGVPGLLAPKTAGRYIKDVVIRSLK